ncbi:MAG: PIN domain-containing protein [Deltaproteobacteria bacterium]|nr:PIN domain-containing protein [Deltaproteobacteria bacterium]
MKKILFDSDVIIEYLRKNFGVVQEIDLLAASEAVLAITPVTEAEIIKGMRSNERERTERALTSLESLDLNRSVGRRAGEYLRKFGKSHGVELADALIAAAAVIHRFSLCTFNWKHYPMGEVERYRISL